MSRFFILIFFIAVFYLLMSRKQSVEGFATDECWCRGGISSGNTKAYTASLKGPWVPPNNTGSLTLSGGTQVWSVSASAWSNAANGNCKMNCIVDSTQTFSSTMSINPASTHMTFPSMMFTTSLPAGSHTFTITLDGSAGSCTSDSNDTVQLQVIEFPKT